MAAVGAKAAAYAGLNRDGNISAVCFFPSFLAGTAVGLFI